MHVISTALFNSNSFENVVTTGIILNEQGKKMSKSKKNYPDPWKVINEFGVDALRFYLMSASLMHAENLFFNERDLRDVMRKNIMLLMNVYRFYSMFADESRIDPDFSGSKIEAKNILDRWILARLDQLVSEVTTGMDNYDLPRATRPITDFIDDLSTWYVRRSRDRFKGEDATDKNNALNTLGYVLLQLSKIIAPFMPFMAEEIWQKVTGLEYQYEDRSVHLEAWPTIDNRPPLGPTRGRQKTDDPSARLPSVRLGADKKQTAEQKNLLEEMAVVRKIVELGLAKRDEAGIKVRQPLAKLRITNYELQNEYQPLVMDELNVKGIETAKGEGDLRVELDTTMTDELKREGMKRELVRTINALRKKAGLTIADRISLYWQGSETMKKVIEQYHDDLLRDTLAVEIIESPTEAGTTDEVKIDGEAVILGIIKK